MNDVAKAKRLLAELSAPPENLPRGWFQERGRQLERLIKLVLDTEDLEPRLNIRPTGEELDGSFALDGRVYLLEAKWRGAPTPASDLYAFKGKVDGKLTGTIGVFITMNRFSPDAVSALQIGKVVNLILFSAEDFRLVVEGRYTFARAMRKKLRYAAEEGSPYLPLEPGAELDLAVREAGGPDAAGPDAKSSIAQLSPQYWDFIVEGRSDEAGLKTLLAGLVATRPIHIRYWVAEGSSNLPGVVRALVAANGPEHVVAFIDADAQGERQRAILDAGVTVVTMDPDLEGWLTPAVPTDWYNMQPATYREKEMRRLGRHADIDQVRQSNAAFDALLRRMGLPSSAQTAPGF